MSDWHLAFDYFRNGLFIAFSSFLILSMAVAGATCAYLLYAFPESKILRQKLLALFPRRSAQFQARLNFVVTLLLGTVVALVVLQPTNPKEAFLAGFAWLGAIRGLSGLRRARPSNTGVGR